ncbi:MAG: hypothetical protein P8X96_12920 [Desulfobacteraceae bacterium]
MEMRPFVTLLREELSTCLAHKQPAAAGGAHNIEEGSETSPPKVVFNFLQGKADLAALSPPDLLDFAIYCNLDFYKTIALILKGEWQWYVVQRLPEGKSLAEFADEGLASLRELSSGFKPAMEKNATYDGLYQLMERHGGLAGASGYDKKAFRHIVNHMVLADIHLFAGNSPELENFVAAEAAERKLLKDAASDGVDEFWKKKRIWIELENEVGTLLLELEEQTLRNRKSQREWMATFGHIYIPLVEAEYHFNSLTYRIERKSEDPALTVEDLDVLEEENRKAEEEHLYRLKQSAVSLKRDLTGPGGLVPEDDETEAYEQECKKILRKIWRLTHPDAIDQERFTTEQKKKLRAYFEEAVPFQEGGRLEDDEITLGMRSLGALRDLLAKVEAVWKSMGLDCNEYSVIQGETLVEQFAWLDQRIASLEEEANQVRVELMAAANDPEFREMDACLVSAEQIEIITDALEAKLDGYKEQNREMERRLEALFAL